MGILSAIMGKKTLVELDQAPTPGTARDAFGAVSAQIRESLSIELRSAVDCYLEAIVEAGVLNEACHIIEDALGPAAKPFGVKASFADEVQELVDSRGGIQKNQALFLRKYEDGRIAFAALWPWSNGKRITLKLGIYD